MTQKRRLPPPGRKMTFAEAMAYADENYAGTFRKLAEFEAAELAEQNRLSVPPGGTADAAVHVSIETPAATLLDAGGPPVA